MNLKRSLGATKLAFFCLCIANLHGAPIDKPLLTRISGGISLKPTGPGFLTDADTPKGDPSEIINAGVILSPSPVMDQTISVVDVSSPSENWETSVMETQSGLLLEVADEIGENDGDVDNPYTIFTYRNQESSSEKKDLKEAENLLQELENEEDSPEFLDCGLFDCRVSLQEKTLYVTVKDEELPKGLRNMIPHNWLLDNGFCENASDENDSAAATSEAPETENILRCQITLSLLLVFSQENEDNGKVCIDEDGTACEYLDIPAEYAGTQTILAENMEMDMLLPSESDQINGEDQTLFVQSSFPHVDNTLNEPSMKLDEEREVVRIETQLLQEDLTDASEPSNSASLSANPWESLSMPTVMTGNGDFEADLPENPNEADTTVLIIDYNTGNKKYLFNPLYIFPILIVSLIIACVCGPVYNKCKGITADRSKILKVPRMAVCSEFPNLSVFTPSMKSGTKADQDKKNNITA